VSKLIAGPGVHICNGCVDLCNRILAGEASPEFTDWSSLGDAELLATLRPTAEAAGSMRELLQQRVDLLRGRGLSWEEIGTALGVSRQAAWERFSP